MNYFAIKKMFSHFAFHFLFLINKLYTNDLIDSSFTGEIKFSSTVRNYATALRQWWDPSWVIRMGAEYRIIRSKKWRERESEVRAWNEARLLSTNYFDKLVDDRVARTISIERRARLLEPQGFSFPTEMET